MAEPLTPIVAVHEAGHAVARALVAGELGYSLHEVISLIDMGAKADRWESGRRVTRDQGSTWGPSLSKEMDMASREFHAAYRKKRDEPGYETDKYWPTTMKLSRAAGADVERWFRARVFQHVSGPIAEAIASNRPFIDVWNGNGWDAEDDRRSLAFDAEIANVGPRTRASTMNRMAVVSASLMDKPDVWAAVLALAEKLPDFGTMDGREAVRIISSTVPESELATLFGKALEFPSNALAAVAPTARNAAAPVQHASTLSDAACSPHSHGPASLTTCRARPSDKPA